MEKNTRRNVLAGGVIGGLIGAFACTAALYGFGLIGGHHGAGPTANAGVVVVDNAGLATVRMRQLLDEQIDASAVAERAQEFSEALALEVKRYSDAGFVVVNKGAVLAQPEQLDVTRIVAQRMGLE